MFETRTRLIALALAAVIVSAGFVASCGASDDLLAEGSLSGLGEASGGSGCGYGSGSSSCETSCASPPESEGPASGRSSEKIGRSVMFVRASTAVSWTPIGETSERGMQWLEGCSKRETTWSRCMKWKRTQLKKCFGSNQLKDEDFEEVKRRFGKIENCKERALLVANYVHTLGEGRDDWVCATHAYALEPLLEHVGIEAKQMHGFGRPRENVSQSQNGHSWVQITCDGKVLWLDAYNEIYGERVNESSGTEKK